MFVFISTFYTALTLSFLLFQAHPDTPMEAVNSTKLWARLISCYVYLSDVSEHQAPLDVWPGTHDHFHFFKHEFRETGYGDAIVLTSPAIRLAVPIGTVVLYDSRVLHRGTENLTPLPRPTLYFSFMGPGEPPQGSTFSIKPKFRGLQLGDILAGRETVPNDAKDTLKEHKTAAREDVEKCMQSMMEFCKLKVRKIWAHQFPSIEDGQLCYACGYELFEVEEDFACKELFHIERVCKFGIYHPDYKKEL